MLSPGGLSLHSQFEYRTQQMSGAFIALLIIRQMSLMFRFMKQGWDDAITWLHALLL